MLLKFGELKSPASTAAVLGSSLAVQYSSSVVYGWPEQIRVAPMPDCPDVLGISWV